jgi:hypothetical protein
MVQALAKHIKQLVALPDELRDTTIRKYKKPARSVALDQDPSTSF